MTVLKERIQEFFRISFYRNAVYLMLTSGAYALTGFFFWAVAAKLYPAEGVGFAAAAISAIGLLALLSTLGLDYGLIRFLPNSGEKTNEMLNSCFTLSGLVSVALAIIFLAGLSLWSPALLFVRQNPIFLIAFLVFTAVSTFRTFTERTFVAKRRADFALAQGIIFGLLRFIPLVALAPFFHTFGIFASWGIALGVAVAVGIPFLLPRIQAGYHPVPAVNRQVIADMMRFSFTNYAANLFWAIPILGLPLMVVNLLGAESNAYFYIGWTLGYLLFSIPITISLSLFAEGSHNEAKLAGEVRRSLKFMLLLIPVIIMVFLLGDKILLLFGKAYSENATELLRILAVSSIPVGLNHIYFTMRRVQKRMKGVVGLSAFIAVITMVLSYLLLPRMGILGVGVAWLIPQIMVAVVATSTLFRYHHQRSLINIDQ